MRNKILSICIAITWLLLTAAAQGVYQERVLYSYNGLTATQPYYALGLDTAGNLYEASLPGRTNPYGSIYRLAKGTSGRWSTTVLYNFRNAGDGGNPNGNLIFDSLGNLYGTTATGGGFSGCSCGTVFELTPTASGPWKETTLYSFKGGSDGSSPFSGLVLDARGNFYGTTYQGGSGEGTVFELSPTSGGGWSETVLHAFQFSDGSEPSLAPLILDQHGNLYGASPFGGVGNCYMGCGTVFELTPSSSGWNFTVLYSFTGASDGEAPGGSVVMVGGNLYGVVQSGGDFSRCSSGCGAVFELSPSSDGTWTKSMIYEFAASGDGATPIGSLVVNRAGHLFGVTEGAGQAPCNYGTAFELSPSSGGGWVESPLHSFCSGTDGASPSAGMVMDTKGNLYGPTYQGGTYNFGTIFKVTP